MIIAMKVHHIEPSPTAYAGELQGEVAVSPDQQKWISCYIDVGFT